MSNSVLVFISHSSEDKGGLVEPLARDLENCYINVWLDKRKIIPGDNLRTSIFRDGLDKADVALIFFTANSLKSSWVDREIKHVLRDERRKGNNFDLNKIISIFDADSTYQVITERYPELTDDLLHLMPAGYSAIQLGQLVSAIWSKYLALQGGDVAIQRQLLEKDREIFQKEQEIQALRAQLVAIEKKDAGAAADHEFEVILASHALDRYIASRAIILGEPYIEFKDVPDAAEARAFGLIEPNPDNQFQVSFTDKGRDFFRWIILRDAKGAAS